VAFVIESEASWNWSGSSASSDMFDHGASMLELAGLAKDPHRHAGLLAQVLRIYLTTLAVLVFAASEPMQGQSEQPLERQMGSIVGTVSNVNGDVVSGAKAVLERTDPPDRRIAVANDNGFFEFHDVQPGIPYHVTVSAPGLAEWTSPVLAIEPSQYKILTGIQLGVPMVLATVDVSQRFEEIATEEVEIAEKQRVFGIFPNFYVVYEPNPVPLTTKLKFRLALKVSIDPITFVGIGMLSGDSRQLTFPIMVKALRGSPSGLALIPPTVSRTS
jgi:hypothetical protein